LKPKLPLPFRILLITTPPSYPAFVAIV